MVNCVVNFIHFKFPKSFLISDYNWLAQVDKHIGVHVQQIVLAMHCCIHYTDRQWSIILNFLLSILPLTLLWTLKVCLSLLDWLSPVLFRSTQALLILHHICDTLWTSLNFKRSSKSLKYSSFMKSLCSLSSTIVFLLYVYHFWLLKISHSWLVPLFDLVL